MLYIEWKGIKSDTIPGLLICELSPITKPKMRISTTTIDGRDGDIIEELGYESYVKTIKIGLTKNYNIDEVAKYFTGEGTLNLSDEPDKIYNCKIVDKIDFEKLLRFKTATVKFHTQPFKYLKDEEPQYLIVTTETSLVVNNKGLETSKPVITLKGSGEIELAVNGSTVFKYTFPEGEEYVIIDSLKEEAYLNGVYKNRNMIGTFPKLSVGNNTITWTGNLTEIKVEAKSRWL